MVSIRYGGRLGNNLYQYIAAYIFAKKFNFKIISSIVETPFNLPPLHGELINEPIIEVTDDNFMLLLESDTLRPAHYRFVGYYQIKDFILKYGDDIKDLLLLSYDNTPKNSLFVVYRIGDINGMNKMLPIEYYREAIKKIDFKEGYITSDTPNHPNIRQLISEFDLKIYNSSPLETIGFGKNFNNIVLSEGSFSWWIGFLSKAENIYYNERPRFWHGDVFVLPKWKSLKYDWCPTCVDSNNRLKCDKIIKK